MYIHKHNIGIQTVVIQRIHRCVDNNHAHTHTFTAHLCQEK